MLTEQVILSYVNGDLFLDGAMQLSPHGAFNFFIL